MWSATSSPSAVAPYPTVTPRRSWPAGCGWPAACRQSLAATTQLAGTFAVVAADRGPQSYRLHLNDGTPVGQMCGISTFCEHTVVSVDSDITKVGLPISIGELTLYEKKLKGGLFGSSNPSADIPRMLELYRAGQLRLDELITAQYSLDDAARGYEDLHAGKNIRGVIIY